MHAVAGTWTWHAQRMKQLRDFTKRKMASSTASTPNEVSVPRNYESLCGLLLDVPCSTWKDREVSAMLFGEGSQSRCTLARVSKVYYARNGRLLFECFFEEIGQTFKTLELDYVMEHTIEVPEMFHRERASIIQRWIGHVQTCAQPALNYFNGLLCGGLAIPLKIFKVARFFVPTFAAMSGIRMGNEMITYKLSDIFESLFSACMFLC